MLALIGGKGLDACQSLSEEEVKNYETLRKTLLEYYDHTEDGYRKKFYNSKPKKGEEFKVFIN